jgi:hypothetical protein
VREQTHISNSHRVRSTTARGCESLESPCDTLDASAGIRPRLRFPLAALVSLAVLIFVLATSAAEATRYQRPFKEDFGTTAQPTFDEPSTLAVDRANGDLLVGERGTDSISRFSPDGTPAPFSALGTNVIDGKPGPGGKPCTEEPASCDQTPQGGLEIQGQDTTGIAIDESGGPTNGDIYVVQDAAGLIDVFSSEGRYLGDLTQEAGGKPLEDPCGVAVDAAGAVYVPDLNAIHKYVPSANPPVNTDNVANLPLPKGTDPEGESAYSLCGISLANGSIFGDTDGGNAGRHAYKINKETGQLNYAFGEGDEIFISGSAVDPTTGDVLLTSPYATEAFEFDVSGESEAVPVGRLIQGQRDIVGIAVANSGDAYIASPSYSHIEVYGTPAVVPTVTAEPAANVSGTKATLTGAVNPGGVPVSECMFEYGETTSYGHTAACEGAIATDSQSHPVHVTIPGLLPNGHVYHYRLVAKNVNGTETSADQTLVTASRAVTRPASEVGTATATLNGLVRPEELQFVDCKFEYGRSTSATFEHSVPCDPPAAAIEPDLSPHAVSAAITGLLADETYRFRLVTTDTEGTLYGEELIFTSLGAPQISEVRARDADQSSAVVEAKVNPSGFATSYRVEWGSTTSYGNSIPAEFEPYVGEGEKPVLVTAKLSGLSVGAAYHYRIVARNKTGTTESSDQVVETLDSCGLPDQRCFEQVSPRDLGPVVARPGIGPGGLELHFQAAAQPGSLAYFVEGGLPEATKGTEVLYVGNRGASGWSSSQFSSPILANEETKSDKAFTSKTLGLSENLECGVVESNQPLTSDAGTRLVREAGGGNLYRRNPDGSYTAISALAPENLAVVEGEGGEYVLAGFSHDCGKVVFSSTLHYPGVEGTGTSRLYEWENGTLRNVGFVPGPGGEVPVEAGAGSPADTKQNLTNVVSSDGSRIFFTATRQTSPDPAEVGKKGVFVREDGARTRDLSLSQTSTPDEGATYQYATKDGSRVFFTANAGLTPESSAEGTDLYEYDLEDNQLTDLSVGHNAGGAEVAGFVGASEDGSHVYFVARGQLVPGRGKTLAQNQSAKTYSLYGEQNNVLSFVGAIGEGEMVRATVEDSPGYMTSQVSPDGRYLLFESTVSDTAYEARNGAAEAYLYDADSGSQATVCVSCRQDGEASVEPVGTDATLLGVVEGSRNPLHATQTLTEQGGVAQVYFTSYDSLAPGAVAGAANVYEWSHGQVFRIASEPTDLTTPENVRLGKQAIQFAGVSADGTDLYFTTPQALNWENSEERWSVYDARVGGGFPEPPPSPSPCSADSEGGCQGASSVPQATAQAASATFAGPGDLVAPLLPSPAVIPTKPKLTRAQQLAKALKACHSYKKKARRVTCERRARAVYGPARKTKAKTETKVKSHKGGK